MKDHLKAALCGLYKYSGAMHVHELVARRKGRSFAAVLLFHRVTDAIPLDELTVSPEWFGRMCRMLARNFRVVPLAEVMRRLREGGRFPERTVAITFDDCYRDNLFAARVLAEHGLPACFFLPTALVGTDHVFAWDRGLKRMPNLSWADVDEIVRLGHDIGSHSVSHADLARVSIKEFRYELAESKRVLEERLGRPVRWLAYPFGQRENVRPDRLALVQELGYEACFSGFGGFIYEGMDGILPREPAPFFRSLLNLELHLRGVLHWMYGLKRRLVSPYERRLSREAALPAAASQ